MSRKSNSLAPFAHAAALYAFKRSLPAIDRLVTEKAWPATKMAARDGWAWFQGESRGATFLRDITGTPRQAE